ILVEHAVPSWMRRAKRGHIGGVARYHQLLLARAEMKGCVTRRVSWRVDEADAGHDLILSFHRATHSSIWRPRPGCAGPAAAAPAASGWSTTDRSRICILQPKE